MWALARRMLGDEATVRHHAVVQRAIGGGIDHAEAIAEHPHRYAAGIERRGVRDRIDAARHPAHDHRTLRHRGREDAGRFRDVRRVVAPPDEANAAPREKKHVAPDVEHRTRLWKVLELLRA